MRSGYSFAYIVVVFVPFERYVRAYAAVVDFSERGHKRHAATQDEFVSYAFAQKIHRVVHYFRAAVAVKRFDCRRVQEVEFDQVESPFVQHGIEYFFNVSAHFFVVDIQRVKTAPVVACAAGNAFFVDDQPVFVLFENFAERGDRKRSQPQSREHAFFVYHIRYGSHSVFYVENDGFCLCFLAFIRADVVEHGIEI